METNKLNKTWILLGILLLAGFLRFYALDKLPPGLYPDEAVNGINTLQILDNADFKVFYPENNGREGFFINLQAISVQIFGATPWALRAPSALIGTLTVLVFYFLLKELAAYINTRAKIRYFQNPELLALLGSFIFAVNSWHIHFSRIGFRAITLPFLLSLAILFLIRGLNHRKFTDFIISGFFWGLGLYSYIGFRLAPLFGIIIFIFDFWCIFRKKEILSIKKFITLYTSLAVSVIITALPLLGFFFAHPEYISSRTTSISVFSSQNPILQLFISLGQNLLMFNFMGDWNWRHNLSGAPVLIFLTGALFLLGIFVLKKDFWTSIKQKNIFTVFPLLFTACWFAVMLLPAVLTKEGLPHALRAIGVIPPTIIFITIGIIWLYIYLVSKDSFKNNAKIFLFVILIFVAAENIHRYFILWGQNNNLPSAFRQDLVDISAFLNTSEESTATESNTSSQITERYIIVNEGDVELDGVPVASATIRFLTEEDPSVHYLKPENLNSIQQKSEQENIIIFTVPDDMKLEKELYNHFPSALKLIQPIIYYKIL